MPVHVDLLLKFARLKFQAEMSSVLLIYSSLFRGGALFIRTRCGLSIHALIDFATDGRTDDSLQSAMEPLVRGAHH